jgi:hypothetical protein
MTYACPAWQFAADNHLLKLQRLQNNVFRTTGKFPMRTLLCDLQLSNFRTYTYNYITKVCMQQAEVLQNHGNANVRNIGQVESRHRKCKRINLGGGQAYDHSCD